MKEFKYNYNNQTGMYRERIEVLEVVSTVDSIGQDIEIYSSVGSYWAMMKSYSNKEELKDGSEKFAVDKRFVVKYNKTLSNFLESVSNSLVIVHKGVSYKVKEALNDNNLNKTLTFKLLGHV